MTRHLSLADVEALHAEMMRAMGWQSSSLRAGGEALLEGAVMRSRMAEHYEGADLIRQAALLGVGISQAQAFVDGNKRTALVAMVTFLEANGCSLDFDDLELARELEKVAERTDSLEAATKRFEAWLRGVVERRGQAPGE